MTLDDGLGLFRKFTEAIKNLPSKGLTPDCLSQFVLEDEPTLQIFYAPFDWFNPAARVTIVGITPGEDSMIAAFLAARSALIEGKTPEEAAIRAKREGMFANMRWTIAEMLDGIGVNRALAIQTTLSLFNGKHADLVHTTSCIRYPVIYKREVKRNYTGHKPKLMRHPPFVRYVEEVLCLELRRLPRAIIVPCGEAVSDALGHLITAGMIDEESCLLGFPHASGANGHRAKHFAERKSKLAETVHRWASR